jgi:succinyl-diaminopimelate desuccinylase
MVDTWATVGSCAQVGRNTHLSGGVGIGGVLEPPQAVPVFVGDECYIGSRCMVVEGARVGDGAVLGAGCILSGTIPVIDADTGEELSRGVVPPWCVAVSATRRRTYPGGEFGMPCVLVIRRLQPGERHDKSRLNDILRQHGGTLRDHMDLLARTAELVGIPSVSHQEAALADHVESVLQTRTRLEVTRIGANVVGRTQLGRGRRVVLAGHLDTVPANGNAVPRIDGDTLWGLGSADMKGGVAVMLELAAQLLDPAVDVTFAFYAGEEVARQHNGLLAVAAAAPDLLDGDAAILGEPTGVRIEAGCQGVLKVEAEIGGTRAHTARPWMGTNAVHRLGPILTAVEAYQGRQPVIDGCAYREALQAVAVSGGVAGNVVPDRATLTLNHRFAPDRTSSEAEAALRALLDPLLDAARGDRLGVVEAQPAAAPALSHPILAALAELTGAPPRGKLGWTDVAFFAERGIPAVNFGPGDAELAHTAGERVDRAALEEAHAILVKLLSAPL